MASNITIPTFITGKMHYVYAHLRIDNSIPFYVGIGTVQKKSKYARSFSKSGRNPYWKNTVAKYGYKIVIFSESDDYSEIMNQERNYISLLGLSTQGGTLVNCTLGGEGCLGFKHSAEHKAFLSQKYSGKNNPMFGRKLTAEQKLKKSKSMAGVLNPLFGKTGALNPRSRKIYQINPLTQEIVATFGSIRFAAKTLGISHSSLNKAIKMGTKSKNYYWSYGS